MTVKFASCECTATDENWQKTGQMKYHDEHDDVLMLEYQCETCGERAAARVAHVVV